MFFWFVKIVQTGKGASPKEKKTGKTEVVQRYLNYRLIAYQFFILFTPCSQCPVGL